MHAGPAHAHRGRRRRELLLDGQPIGLALRASRWPRRPHVPRGERAVDGALLAEREREGGAVWRRPSARGRARGRVAHGRARGVRGGIRRPAAALDGETGCVPLGLEGARAGF